MAGEWREITVGELAPFSYGKSLPESRRNADGNVPVYGSNGIVGFHDEPLTAGPTIIIGRKGTVGVVHYSPVPCWPIDTTFFVSGTDLSLVRYRYYLLKSIGLEQMNADSAVPGLNRDAAHARRVRVPMGEDEQRAIAHILGTLDDKIELNRRMSETLEAMAQALFKAWFVDFDPVRAKMEGRWQRGQSLPGLPAHLYDLFPDRLVDSELGEIPEGWEVGTLGDVAEHPRRNVRPSEIDTQTPYIALEHMPQRCIALAWGYGDRLESNKFRFNRGEILFGKLRPYFHKVGVAPLDGVCSTDIVVIRPKAQVWFAFVLGHASSVEFVEYTNAGSTGTKMPRTSWTEMARYEMVLPPESVAAAFNERMQPAIGRIIEAIHESRTLAALRDALLPKLISGQIRVKDAEKFLQERDL